MQLVEQHLIKKTDPRYPAIDAACFASKNLYNAALYEVRQAFIFQRVYLNYNTMDKRMQSHEAYKALPAKVAQQVLKLLDKNWQAFFKAMATWREHPEQLQGRPKLPKYKDKVKGRNILIYTAQAVSKAALKKAVVKPSQLDIEVVSICPEVDQVRIVPRIVNGRPVKSINQFYNKRRAGLQSKLAKEDANWHTSKRLERLTNKRTRKIDHYLHTSSRRMIDLLVSEGIGTLVIGYNQEWKQEVNIGKRNNQNFVNIPFARFIHMLTYKAELVGIRVVLTEESYTSKCSFLDFEPIGKHDVYAGKRVKRGLFRSASGKQYNADANGSYNTIRKVASDAFVQGSRRCVVHPTSLA